MSETTDRQWEAVTRLMKWISDFGNEKEPQVIEYLTTVMCIAIQALKANQEPVSESWWRERFGQRHVELRNDFGLFFSTDDVVELYAEGPKRDDSIYTIQLTEPTRADIETIVRLIGKDSGK